MNLHVNISFLYLGKYLGVGSLGCMASVSLSLCEMTKLICKLALLFLLSTSSV